MGCERFVLCVRVTEDVGCTLGPAAADNNVVGSAEPDGVELEAFGSGGSGVVLTGSVMARGGVGVLSGGSV